MSPWKVILATMVIFGCGVVTGALLMKTELPVVSAPADPVPRTAASTNPPPPFNQFQRPEFLRRIQKQLDLTASQSEEITKLMKASQERCRPLWDPIEPELRKEAKRVREEIRQVLTPEQQKKYDELLKPRARKADGSNTAPARPARPLPEPSAPTNAL